MGDVTVGGRNTDERSISQWSLDQDHDNHTSRFFGLMPRWIPQSMKALIDSEIRLLQAVSSVIRGCYVPIQHGSGGEYLWSIQVTNGVAGHQTTADDKHGGNSSDQKVPLVLMHGFGAGCGIWANNLDAWSKHRAVYAFDLLGFGQSSRSKLSDDPVMAELEWVQSVEDWRRHMKIDKMILLGHSLGGYLASSYALEHPNRVRHLVLVDPWGFPYMPPDSEQKITLPTWVRAVAKGLSYFTPLASVRAAGPFGPQMVRRFRPDIGRRYSVDGVDSDAIYDYLYQCNAQRPTGEMGFKSLSIPFGWAKRPMVERLPLLRSDVPITFIYGGRSWIDAGPGYELQHELRPRSYVSVQVVKGAGHHVYADQPAAFNAAVDAVCQLVDEAHDTPPVLGVAADVAGLVPPV